MDRHPPQQTGRGGPLLHVGLIASTRDFGCRTPRTKHCDANLRKRRSDFPSTPRHAACRTLGARSD